MSDLAPPKPSLEDLRIERRPEPAARSRSGWLWLVGLVVVLGVGAWLLTRPRDPAVTTVPARAPASGSAVDHTVLNASGYVTARRQATVSSKVTGKVVEVLIEEGMKVKEGQVLARLDDTNVRASLDLAVAQLVSATNALAETRVRIREANQELQRQAKLVETKSATQADFDPAEATALAYKAQLQRQEADAVVAQRTVTTWQQQMDDLIIRAPFDGIVTSKNAQPGEMISPISAGGGFTRTGICIVDMQSLEIEIDVNESYINRVEAAQPVEATLDAYSDWKIPCKVIAIIPTADRAKSTVKVRVGFDKLDPRILPEMSIKVAFREIGNPSPAAAAVRAVIVPKSAVQQVEGRDVVFVAQGNRAERRAVTAASSTGEEVVLSAGVAAGENVITDPPKDLKDGGGVKVRAEKK